MPSTDRPTDSELARLAERLESREITDPHEIYAAISDLGEARYTRAREAVEAFLRHEDGEVRGAAILTLGMWWKLPDHRSTCEEMMSTDRDVHARRKAAAALGSLLAGTHDKRAMKMLARVVRDRSEELRVRSTAYESILHIRGVPPNEHRIGIVWNEYQLVERVDWKLVEEAEGSS